MSGTQGREGDEQLVAGDVDVGGRGERGLDERPSFVGCARIVRRHEPDEIALSLEGDHLEQVGQMLALRGELDHRAIDDLSHRHASRHPRALRLESGEAFQRGDQRARLGGLGDLEAAHGLAHAFDIGEGFQAVLRRQATGLDARLPQLGVERVPVRVGHLARGVGVFDGVLGERIEGVLLAHVLEEIFLTPTLEHAEGDLHVVEIEA